MPRRVLSTAVLGTLGLLTWLWLSGGFDQLAAYATAQQRVFQNDIAGTLRRLRGGEGGAMALLMLACFSYGFFHAVGPGHGKVLVGGYGLGRAVPAFRLSLIALLASLGQALTAILLVYGGLWLWGLTREHLIGTAERIMAPVSYGAIALVGVWLLLRGLRRLLRTRGMRRAPGHAHSREEEACETCGHRHGPSLQEVQAVQSWQEAVVLIASIALRPCTGAIFVLLITWQMGIPMAGILGALVMALGTALVTVSVGLAAVGVRGGLLRGLADAPVLIWAVPVIEISAGAIIALLAGGLLYRAI